MGEMEQSLAPGFLVAVPHLMDENFHRSVVLLLEQNELGAMGVVINREGSLLLAELCQDHEIPYEGVAGKRVRTGGPLEPEQGMVLYGNEHSDPEGTEVLDGLYLSTARSTLSHLCTLPRGRFECFSGYAGWGPSQLEDEIAGGAWLMCPARPRTILESDPDGVWRECLDAMGIDPAALVPGGGAPA